MNATVAKYVERLKPDQTMDPFDSLVFLCIFFFCACDGPHLSYPDFAAILQLHISPTSAIST